MSFTMRQKMGLGSGLKAVPCFSMWEFGVVRRKCLFMEVKWRLARSGGRWLVNYGDGTYFVYKEHHPCSNSGVE